VAKGNLDLMVPLWYGTEEMMHYCGYSYDPNPEKCSKKIILDVSENRQVWKMNREPSKFNWDGKTQNPNYETELSKHLDEERVFTENLASGAFVEIPNIVWKKNFEFSDKIKVDGFSRGRSAADFELISLTTGKTYSMFMKDVLLMIQESTIKNGVVSGVWTFCKRGANYGLKLVKEDLE